MTEHNKASDSKKDTGAAMEAAERHAGKAAHALDAKLSGPLAPLESALDDIFGKKAPFQLPNNIKDTLVKIAPWLALLGGVFGIVGAIGMWNAAHTANRWIDAINDAYGAIIPTQAPSLTLWFWLSLATMVLFAVLAFISFPGLRAKKKVGWNLMFYSMLANILYGVVSLFYSGGGTGSFVSALISSVIGLYILFQVRAHYK